MAVALRRWTAPGWYRALFGTLFMAAFVHRASSCCVRELYGYDADRGLGRDRHRDA